MLTAIIVRHVTEGYAGLGDEAQVHQREMREDGVECVGRKIGQQLLVAGQGGV
jgi:hypothetical protein